MPPPQPVERRARPLVLLVEDHVDTRLMYAEYLGLTFDVQPVENADAALAFLTTCRPDVAITDVALPGMTGLELVARMRSDPALAGVPIICLSGFDAESLGALAQDAGCDRLLQKPCLPDALAQAVDEVLQSSQGRSAVL